MELYTDSSTRLPWSVLKHASDAFCFQRNLDTSKFHYANFATQIMSPTFMICDHDFSRGKVLVKVNVMEFGL